MKYKNFFIGFAIFNGSILFAILLSLLIRPSYVFFLIALILGPLSYSAINVFFNPKYGILVWASIIIGLPIFTIVGLGYGGYPYSKLFTHSDEMISNISVTEAPKYQDYYMFDFKDGVLMKDYMGEYKTGNSYKNPTTGRTSGTINKYHLTPIVANNAKFETPITLWTTPSNSQEYQKGVLGKIQGYNLNKSVSFKNYKKAIANAEKKYGLKSDPNAIIMTLKEDPQGTLFGQKILTWFILSVSNLFYIILYIVRLRN